MMLNDGVAALALVALIATRNVALADVVICAAMFLVTMAGVEVGLHRLFSHRAFVARAPLAALLGVAGATGLQGHILTWVTVHRRHHRHSDRPGDPHSPNLSGDGIGGWIRGLWNVHAAAQFAPEVSEIGSLDLLRYSRDLLRDPIVMRIDRLYYAWVALGIVIPAGLGWLAGGTMRSALLGALWGGPIRILITHQVTWTVNSAAHLIGSHPYETRDCSTNLGWLALPTMGGSWHNNHHAFPASARAGLAWWQLDPGYWLIRSFARLGLANDVRLRGPGDAPVKVPEAGSASAAD